jgi:hypothetical protein
MGEREALRHAGGTVGSLERARDHEGGSKTAWCADYWRGEPGQEVVVEGVKRVKYVPKPSGMYKMVNKWAVSHTY